MKAVLYVWRYYSLHLQMWDDEERAASMALEIFNSGNGSVQGVQLEDGTLYEDMDEWPAYVEAEKLEQAEYDAEDKARREHPPPPSVYVTSPFDHHELAINDRLGALPSWVGKHE